MKEVLTYEQSILQKKKIQCLGSVCTRLDNSVDLKVRAMKTIFRKEKCAPKPSRSSISYLVWCFHTRMRHLTSAIQAGVK